MQDGNVMISFYYFFVYLCLTALSVLMQFHLLYNIFSAINILYFVILYTVLYFVI